MEGSIKLKNEILLSIAIPAYNRGDELEYALKIFIDQIKDTYEELIEVCITDDNSPKDLQAVLQKYINQYPFIKYKKVEINIGLEKNLIHCTRWCRGKYLWIFGDDDFLEPGALDYIMPLIIEAKYEYIIVNRVRRNTDLSKTISYNWMGLDTNKDIYYPSLIDFLLNWGIISVIGFITVNIFIREKFHKINDNPHYNTMYPQLFMMIEAFSHKPCYLIGRPLICHRTQTALEKNKLFQNKEKEKDFMQNSNIRDATYFSFRIIKSLMHLVNKKSLTFEVISQIREHTVINGLLTDFIFINIKNSLDLRIKFLEEDWKQASVFFTAINNITGYERYYIRGRTLKLEYTEQEKKTRNLVSFYVNRIIYYIFHPQTAINKIFNKY